MYEWAKIIMLSTLGCEQSSPHACQPSSQTNKHYKSSLNINMNNIVSYYAEDTSFEFIYEILFKYLMQIVFPRANNFHEVVYCYNSRLYIVIFVFGLSSIIFDNRTERKMCYHLWTVYEIRHVEIWYIFWRKSV